MQAPIEQTIIKQCLRLGHPLPKRIQDAPQLQLGLELFYDAFWDLNGCRTFGMGMGPIPWTAIKDFAQAFEFDEEQFDDLYYYVRRMDDAYLKHHAPKKKGKK